MAYCLFRLQYKRVRAERAVGEVELHFQRCLSKASYRRSSVVPRLLGVFQPDPTGESPVTTAKPPTRYGAN
jgi:hypothetical protein